MVQKTTERKQHKLNDTNKMMQIDSTNEMPKMKQQKNWFWKIKKGRWKSF